MLIDVLPRAEWEDAMQEVGHQSDERSPKWNTGGGPPGDQLMGNG